MNDPDDTVKPCLLTRTCIQAIIGASKLNFGSAKVKQPTLCTSAIAIVAGEDIDRSETGDDQVRGAHTFERGFH